MNNNELCSHLLLKACDCCVFNVIVLVRFYCASVFKIAKGTYSCMCSCSCLQKIGINTSLVLEEIVSLSY